jgi:anhydro-N-acetylmuramic acid kinase
MIMEKKVYTAIGLMSGTSMDGVDASIINSDGSSDYTGVLDKYFEYDNGLQQKLIKIRDKIISQKDFEKILNELKSLEREITLFHAKVVNSIIKDLKTKIDFVGFHGQTIFHEPKNKTSVQIGNGELLSQLTKKKVVYDFRQKDLKNGGQGAPLTPIFHNLVANKINKNFKTKFPIFILNIGGISNLTCTVVDKNNWENLISAFDIGPGNCLIDEWIRKNSKMKYDENGSIARSGTTDQLILNQALENFKIESYEKSLDIKNFDISFVKGLSLENGASTLVDFTTSLISQGINFFNNTNSLPINELLICGGGRKNKYLIECIKKKMNNSNNTLIENIEKYEIDGDFVESQAFAFLAIRSYLKLPISFPNTTRCKDPTTGGVITENF